MLTGGMRAQQSSMKTALFCVQVRRRVTIQEQTAPPETRLRNRLEPQFGLFLTKSNMEQQQSS